MIQYYNFYKNQKNQNWYIDLPEWKGNIEELQMVLGADTLLDILAQDDDKIYIAIALTPFDHTHELHYKSGEDKGGWYELKSNLHNFDLWLCEVTQFIFGFLPEIIYMKKNKIKIYEK